MKFIIALVMVGVLMAAVASATDFNVGLVNYWNLSKMPDTNTTMADVVGGADLPVVGSPADAVELNPAGGVGYELSAGNYFDSYSVPSFGFGVNITYNFWVNISQAGVDYLYTQAGSGSYFNDRGLSILWIDDGGSYAYGGLKAAVNVGDCGGSVYDLKYAMPSDSYNAWHMVSLVVTNESISAYWDGSLINTTLTPLGFCVGDTSGGFHMGMGDNNLGARVLDEFGIWSYSMSGGQIAELYNGGLGIFHPFAPASMPQVTIAAVVESSTALIGQCFAQGASNYSYVWYVNGTESNSGNSSSWSLMVATPYQWFVDGTVGTFVYRFNEQLQNDLNISSPDNVGLAVAVDSNFGVYWSDYARVLYSDVNGINLRNFSEAVNSIAVDKDGNVWMVGAISASKYDSSGGLLITINYDSLYGFQAARAVIDHNNNLWLTRRAGADVIMKFDEAGNNILNISRAGRGDLYYGNAVVDADNNLIVADYINNTYTKYDENGTQLAQVNLGVWAQAVAMDLDGNFWGVDSWSGEVFKMDSSLTSLINLTLEGSNGAVDVWVDAKNQVWVSDFTRISVFNATDGNLLFNETIGSNIESWGDANGLILQRLIGGQMPVVSNLTYFNAGDSVVFECAADGGIPLNSSVFVPSFGSGVCVEDWTCTVWGDCVESLQNRTCTDNSLCGTNLTKPVELQSCTVPSAPLQSVTGFGVFGLLAELGAGMAVLFGLIAMPLGVLLLSIAIIGAVMLIIGAVVKWLS